MQRGDRNCSRWWPHLVAVEKVTQYHRLVAGILPNQIEARFDCQRLGLLIACRRYSLFVGIEQHERRGKAADIRFRVLFPSLCQLHQSEGVAAARSEKHSVQKDPFVLTFHQS
jgi:hypothetical protein